MKTMNNDTPDIFKSIAEKLPYPWKGLRFELKLHRGGLADEGRRTFLLEDPIEGTYFQIGEWEASLVVCLSTEPDIKSAVKKFLEKTSLTASPSDIIAFISMLQRERLAVLPWKKEGAPLETTGHPEEQTGHFIPTGSKKRAGGEKREGGEKKTGQKKTALQRLSAIVTGYLFIKLPLWRPDAFVTKALPWVAPLWSRPFLWFCAIFSMMGVLLVIQEWELYVHTASHLFTPFGAAAFFFSISVVKTLHEFGHAFAAKRQGIFVRRMGVALMVFMPIFYCDVSDAWGLRSKKGRMLIAASGIFTELAVAGMALFFWAILPGGVVKSVMFYLSGASIVSSIMVNMNPLMRFDAYYMLMDYLEISNLRRRSKALFLHSVRRALVDWRGPIPEIHSRHGFLVAFGAFCLAYQAFIFFVISMVVYQFVFKALGVVLVMAQIFLILIVPLAMEIRFLSRNRSLLGRPKRMMGTVAVLAGIGALVVFPLPKTHRLPGFFLFEKVVEIRSSDSGRLTAPLPALGQMVVAGEALSGIENRALNLKRRQLFSDFQKTESVMETLSLDGAEGGYRKWLMEEKTRIGASIQRVDGALFRLLIRSPLTGRVEKINDTIGKDSYVAKKTFLVTVADRSRHEVRAYANVNLRRRLMSKKNRTVRILFGDMETPVLTGRLERALDFPEETFVNAWLFDFAGGPVASVRTPEGAIKPMAALYPLVFRVLETTRVRTLKHGHPCAVHARLWESWLARFGAWAWAGLSGEGIV